MASWAQILWHSRKTLAERYNFRTPEIDKMFQRRYIIHFNSFVWVWGPKSLGYHLYLTNFCPFHCLTLLFVLFELLVFFSIGLQNKTQNFFIIKLCKENSFNVFFKIANLKILNWQVCSTGHTKYTFPNDFKKGQMLGWAIKSVKIERR